MLSSPGSQTMSLYNCEQYFKDFGPKPIPFLFSYPSFSSFSYVLAIPLLCCLHPWDTQLFWPSWLHSFLYNLISYFTGIRVHFCASLYIKLLLIQGPTINISHLYINSACLSEKVNYCQTILPSNTTMFVASKWNFSWIQVVGVDPDCPSFNGISYSVSTLYVPAKVCIVLVINHHSTLLTTLSLHT